MAVNSPAPITLADPAVPHRNRSDRNNTRETLVPHDDGEGNWLVSYADMMTLLFGFFVILASFSTPDAKKLEKLKEETAKSTGGKYVPPYESLTQRLHKLLKDSGLDRQLSIEQTDEGVQIVSKGTLFFDSGSSSLKDQALKLVNEIAPVLVEQAREFRIVVEGHTDDTPIVSRLFPSNWELSSSRASTVVRLLEEKGFPHEKLRPVGFADTEPLVPGRDVKGMAIAENQAQNRRIVIRIVRQLPQRLKDNH